MRFINKWKQQKTQGGQISPDKSSPFQRFLISAPRSHDIRKFCRCYPSPFFRLFSITEFFLHRSGGELSLGWICFSCTMSATSSQCWDTVSEFYHVAQVWFGRLKKLPLLFHHTPSPPPTLSTHRPSPGCLHPMPMHAAKAEVFAVWYFWTR